MKDPCIRRLLRETELQHFYLDLESKVVEELTLPIARARIDMAVINGAFHGYEIKSASDTLQRLPSQIEAYTKVFDYLSIVTESKYEEQIFNEIPEWIGIFLCDDKKDFKNIKKIREPIQNKDRESFFIAKLLWREELLEILTAFEIPFRKKDRNWLLCEALAKNLDLDTISSVVRSKLKLRPNWKK